VHCQRHGINSEKSFNEKHLSMKPLVSVVTPAHNAAAILLGAINAVAHQTVGSVEHIVIDDGSNDGTLELLQELSREVPHLRYLRQRRQGAGMARNVGIEAAEGRYVAFLDSDDLWLPRKLEAQMGFMEDHQCVFSYGDYYVRDQARRSFRGTFKTPEKLTHQDLLRGCPIGCLTAAYNQEALGKAYMPNIARGQDWALWLSLTRDGTPAMRYPGAEAVYHRGRGSLSANKLSKSLDMYRIYREQENIGAVTAFGYLLGFAIHSLRKRWLADRGELGHLELDRQVSEKPSGAFGAAALVEDHQTPPAHPLVAIQDQGRRQQ
jgi:teichuronic acid biosynthesis glycosyltransferase TuaG